MYVGIDIGASKTLIASFSDSLELIDSFRIETSHDPEELVSLIAAQLARAVSLDSVKAIGLAVPGRIDDDGLVTNTTTLDWQEVPLQRMLAEHVSVPIYIENDAVLGGLGEARFGHGQGCANMLYITISTGVGTGIIVNGRIPDNIKGSEGGHMLLNHDGRDTTVESLVSGTAFKQRFGRYGFETDDQKTWDIYGQDLAKVVYDMSALLEPDCVIIGGGMAVHYDRFSSSLNNGLAQLRDEVFRLPVVKPAKNPEMAVVYGCVVMTKESAV